MLQLFFYSSTPNQKSGIPGVTKFYYITFQAIVPNPINIVLINITV